MLLCVSFNTNALFSYAILAADAAKSSSDAKQASMAMLQALQKRGELKAEEALAGLTKVRYSQVIK